MGVAKMMKRFKTWTRRYPVLLRIRVHNLNRVADLVNAWRLERNHLALTLGLDAGNVLYEGDLKLDDLDETTTQRHAPPRA